MANHLYNYSQPYTSSTLPTSFPSRGSSFTDPYLSDTSLLSSSRYLTSDPHSLPDYSRYPGTDKASLYLNQNETLRFSGTDGAGAFSGGHGVTTPSLLTHSSWTTDPALAGIKRPGEALYHQNIVGTHTSIGKSDVLFSTNPLAKRPRIESASNLPIYPQRPGEKDCAHYMLTRTCKFGDTCKFDHPLWVPECGIPDWKEVPLIATSESLPERPGEPDCPYYLKTQKCKYGFRCKFNHPKDINASATADGNTEEFADVSILPERQSEPLCTFYAKTGKCKFGAHCKFNHPKDLPIPSAVNDPTVAEQNGFAATDGTTTEAEAAKKFVPFTPALLHNSKGLPIRPGEVDCPFYLKTGSCKYSATCRYNHPEWNAINPPVAVSLGLGHAMINSPAINLPLGVVNHAASILPHASLDPRLAQTTLALGPTTYPQRPGQLECDFYMKTGVCKFGERCKFHHPIDRSAPTSSVVKPTLQQNVKLTLAGLPRREGEAICAYYMKTGTCKYGATCRFDHPPPGEAIALAAAQGAAVEEEKPANGAEQ